MSSFHSSVYATPRPQSSTQEKPPEVQIGCKQIRFEGLGVSCVLNPKPDSLTNRKTAKDARVLQRVPRLPAVHRACGRRLIPGVDAPAQPVRSRVNEPDPAYPPCSASVPPSDVISEIVFMIDS